MSSSQSELIIVYSGNQSTVTEFILLGLSSDPFIQIVLFHIFLVIYMTNISGNMLLIAAVRASKHLHTSMYNFLSSLSFLDICYISSIVPQTLVNFLRMKKTISFTGCAVQFFFSLLLGVTESLLLTFMSYDRYVAICSPLHYNMIMSQRVSLWIISMSCLAGCIISCIVTCFTFTLTYCGNNTIDHFICELPVMLQLSCSDISAVNILKLVGLITTLSIPLLLILISYIRIVATIVTIRAGKNKAFSTCVSHLVVVALFYGTAIFMYSRPEHSVTRDTDKKVAVFYTVVTPTLNPLIYSLRNKDVQRGMRQILVGLFPS